MLVVNGRENRKEKETCEMAGFKLSMTITGIQAAMAANQKVIAALKPAGAFGRAVRGAVIAAHRYETAITHVDTGALRASHRMQVNGLRGMVFTDPTTVNPRSGRRTIDYAFWEHQRGFPHNYAERTVIERGADIAQEAEREFMSGLP